VAVAIHFVIIVGLSVSSGSDKNRDKKQNKQQKNNERRKKKKTVRSSGGQFVALHPLIGSLIITTSNSFVLLFYVLGHLPPRQSGQYCYSSPVHWDPHQPTRQLLVPLLSK
jgi:hypothetical protein